MLFKYDLDTVWWIHMIPIWIVSFIGRIGTIRFPYVIAFWLFDFTISILLSIWFTFVIGIAFYCGSIFGLLIILFACYLLFLFLQFNIPILVFTFLHGQKPEVDDLDALYILWSIGLLVFCYIFCKTPKI